MFICLIGDAHSKWIDLLNLLFFYTLHIYEVIRIFIVWPFQSRLERLMMFLFVTLFQDHCCNKLK